MTSQRSARTAPLIAFGLVFILGIPGISSAQAPAATPSNAAVRPLPLDHILRYEELTGLLQAWAAERPGIVELTSIGVTPKGRQMWFLTLTNRKTGPAREKPALLVEGNQHATEWAGGVAALHFTWKLVREYGTDPRITQLLDTRAVYIMPRLTPDGVEAALTQGRFIRSVDRAAPDGPPQPGIHAKDIDGDGRSVFMRLRDANGPWKPHKTEPRLLVARDPDEWGGDYWRLLPEGTIVDFDGETIADPPAVEGLDFGQNFPTDKRHTPEQPGAGAYPASVPEMAAYVAAIAARPNIVAHVTCHTFGGLILTPPVNLDDRMPTADKQAYDTLAGEAARRTGYRPMSYLDLRTTEKESFIPSAFGWLYDRKGIYSFITEFWDPWRDAGISLDGTIASAWLSGFHPVEDELKFLRWNDEQVGGRCFVPWRPFTHPQLGAVEIGGWDLINCWYNIPFDRLEKEIAPHSEWLVYLGLASPRLAMRSLTAEPVNDGVWRVRAVVENTGWLPTSGTRQAVERQAVGPVRAEIALPAGARLVSGTPWVTLGQLEGRSAQRSTATWWGYVPGTPDRAMAEWLIAAPSGTEVSVTISHDRAGLVRAALPLKAAAQRKPAGPGGER